MSNASKAIAVAFLTVFLVVGFVALGTWMTKVCWNAIIPAIFGLPELSFSQAFFLLALSKILLGTNFQYRKNNS